MSRRREQNRMAKEKLQNHKCCNFKNKNNKIFLSLVLSVLFLKCYHGLSEQNNNCNHIHPKPNEVTNIIILFLLSQMEKCNLLFFFLFFVLLFVNLLL